MSARMALMVAALAGVSACELREITLATPDDVIVAEIVLRAGADMQTAYLHRTSMGESSARVFGAQISITDVASGSSFVLDVQPDAACLDPAPPADRPDVGTCYGAHAPEAMIHPGRSYTLRIELADGGVLTGSTTVPADFRMLRPGIPSCVLPARTLYELVWTRSEGTSVYLVEAEMEGLGEALRRAGVDAPGLDTVDLLGLAISAEDTILTFPAELGLFDRLDEDLHAILVAMQTGLPEDVRARLSVAAADRNYVNWVRGGNFNPSGDVRISSLRGPGIGVFGSLVVRPFEIRTDRPSDPSGLPGCP